MMCYQDGNVVFDIQIPLAAFSQLAQKHHVDLPQTENIESQVVLLREFNFTEEGCANFVRNVCKWGGYAGIAERVLNNNSSDKISTAIQDADRMLFSGIPDIEGALKRINSLNGLGQISFASKHLRFLAPQLCPVFDSILQARLPYPPTIKGYIEFSRDCGLLAEKLSQMQAINPWVGRRGVWLVADVEACIYQYVNSPQGQTFMR